MAKEKLFDWFSFLNKKILKCQVFDIKKNVCMSFWSDKKISQGEHFNFDALISNPWDCPVKVDLNLKVTPYTMFATKKKAKKLVLPRKWQVQLSPGEIALIKMNGYACIGCKSNTISFSKAQVSKQGKGKQLFKYKGKPLRPSISPLGFLLLPLGWIVISWNTGASLMLKISKNKMKMQGISETVPEPQIQYETIWSPEKSDKLNLAPLLDSYFKDLDENSRAEMEKTCLETYSKWHKKHKPDPSLNALRAGSEQAEQQIPLTVS